MILIPHQLKSLLENVHNSKESTDICIYYDRNHDMFLVYNYEELTITMNNMKKSYDNKNITLVKSDHECHINGVPYYIMTILKVNNNIPIDCDFNTTCPLSLGLDLPIMIDGTSYAFEHEKHRDMVLSYVLN